MTLRSTLLLVVCLAVPALAQEDRPAGLFTRARQLPMVNHTVRVVAADGVATVEVTQVFHNDGPDEGQADFQFRLPVGAALVGFGFWDGATLRRAELKEKSQAEAAHQAAAAEGRTTALVETGSGLQRFSVYPLHAGELKRVITTLRLPVARELGRSQVRVPLEAFLGEAPLPAAVSVQLASEDVLAELGVDGAGFSVVDRSERAARLVLQASGTIDLWWIERGAPLTVSADAVPLGAGQGYALQVRAALNDAGPWKAPYRQVHVLVDGSFSMKRRAFAVRALVARLVAQAPVQPTVHVVAERTLRLERGDLAQQTEEALLQGTAGFGLDFRDVQAALHRLECRASGVRCVLLTDPHLTSGLEPIDVRQLEVPVIVLSDTFERAAAEGKLPPDARLVDPDVDAPAKLAALADQLVLPTLELHALDAPTLSMPERQERRVAEGGLLRLFASVETPKSLRLLGTIAEQPWEQVLDVSIVEADSATGQAIRRGFYERRLADWMRDYASAPSDELKQRIIALSLQERIPTSFTAMHVASPELSMVDIKPGDPLLVVPAVPGLVEVTAWYPFGAWRRLQPDDGGARFVDRFLVPRGWGERWYEVLLFERFQDGTVREGRAWYRLDETAPSVTVRVEGTQLLVRDADPSRDLSSVRVELEGRPPLVLSAMGGVFSAPVASLGERFTLVVRDRAGNRSSSRFVRSGDGFSPEQPRERTRAPSKLPQQRLTWDAAGTGLTASGGVVTLAAPGGDVTFSAAQVPLRSLEVTGVLARDDGATLLFGTAGGDLVQLACTAGACEPTFVGGSRAGHPITGLVEQGAQVLVGVLGEGLQRFDGATLRATKGPSSRYVTSLARSGADVLVGTAYAGLWRVLADGRVIKTRFAHRHVGALVSTAAGLEVWSGAGRALQQGRDRFVALPGELPVTGRRAHVFTAGVALADGVVVGSFDEGVGRLDARGTWQPLPVALTVLQRQVNAMQQAFGALWLGTEGGLIEVDPHTWASARRSERAVYDVEPCGDALIVASAEGVHRVTARGVRTRVDVQGVGTGHFMSAACVGDDVYAGGLEGLFRFGPSGAAQLGAAQGFDAGWVTALTVHRGKLVVGTYASGVFEQLPGARFQKVRGLERQWVTPHGLRTLNGALWVGGLGQPAVWGGEAWALPARDTFELVPVDEGAWALTSSGAMRVRPVGGVSRR